MPSPVLILRAAAVLSVFIVYDYVYWIVLFGDRLGVPEMGLQQWAWFHGASAVMAICFVTLFDRCWPESGIRNGLVFGLIAGTFWGIGELYREWLSIPTGQRTKVQLHTKVTANYSVQCHSADAPPDSLTGREEQHRSP